MIKLDKAVIVEGKYDKIKLSGFLDAEIITTDGFKIFRDRDKLNLIRRVAEKRGIIILTDSDSAGFMIRGRISGAVSAEYITNVYVPEMKGKERRKNASSAEGLLGVEGMTEEIIMAALDKAGVTSVQKSEAEPRKPITSADLYSAGLSGTDGSSERRTALEKRMSLPVAMSKSQLLAALNLLYTRDEFIKETEGL